MRRWRGFSLVSALLLILWAPTATFGATSPSTIPVLRVFIPGHFGGCTTTSSGSSEALKDVLSLVRPSAFLVNPVGRLVGAGGPIASAELISDEPQTIVVTIDPRFTWSNGAPFTVHDLINRIEFARTSRAAWADGFHRIESYSIGSHRKSLKLIFSQKYASWPTMFQGIEQATAPLNCDITQVAQRPSLGPYLLESLNSDQAVLVANPQYRVRSQQFRTIIITAGQSPSATVGRPIVDYRYAFSQMDATWLASLPGRSGKISASQRVVAVTFSPRTAITQDIDVRKVLSLAIDRHQVINTVYGSITQSLSPATSSLLAQGQIGYVAKSIQAPFLVTATTSTTIANAANGSGSHGFECVSCASAVSSSTVSFSSGQLRWYGSGVTVRLAVGPSESSRLVSQRIANAWRRIGVSVQIIGVSSDRLASQAVAGGDVEAAVTSAATSHIGVTATSWYGPRRSDTVDFGWRSAVCDSSSTAAEANFNATTALEDWARCDDEIARQYWQRPIVSVPYLLQWTNTVVGVAPSNTTRGFIDQIPLWSSLQRR